MPRSPARVAPEQRQDALAALYREAAALTQAHCDPATCRDDADHRCCRRAYCDAARHYALAAWGVVLPPPVQDPIPYLDPATKRCVVPAHLRPTCALHHCALHRPHAPPAPWISRYREIRAAIEALENPADPDDRPPGCTSRSPVR